MNRPYERQGAFAELITVPNTNIYNIPEKLNVMEAAVDEPTAVAYHAVQIGEKSLKKDIKDCRILVQGAGAIGLLCSLILSKIKNNQNMIMSDPNELRLNECSKYVDAKFVGPSDKEVNADGFDIVFDTVGLEISRQQAINVVKPLSLIHI